MNDDEKYSQNVERLKVGGSLWKKLKKSDKCQNIAVFKYIKDGNKAVSALVETFKRKFQWQVSK